MLCLCTSEIKCPGNLAESTSVLHLLQQLILGSSRPTVPTPEYAVALRLEASQRLRQLHQNTYECHELWAQSADRLQRWGACTSAKSGRVQREELSCRSWDSSAPEHAASRAMGLVQDAFRVEVRDCIIPKSKAGLITNAETTVLYRTIAIRFRDIKAHRRLGRRQFL